MTARPSPAAFSKAAMLLLLAIERLEREDAEAAHLARAA